jgi:ABC-2 type transport system permease protein
MGFHILALIRKEFLALFKDKRSRITIIGPPIFQLFVFGYAASFDLDHVPFAIYSEDPGEASRVLAARFIGAPVFELQGYIDHEGAIAPLIDNKEVLAVLHIGPSFSADLARGRPAPVQLLIDGRNSNTALILLNYARNIVIQFNQDWLHQQGRSPTPAVVTARAWFNPNLASRWFFVPGIIALLSLVVSVLITALSVAREREAGTFDQLLVTPLRPVEILLGKAVPGLVIGLIEGTVIIVLAVYWFDIPFNGSLLALYIGFALLLLSSIGVGLMISSLSATQQQGLLGGFLFLVPAVILSGFATPIANMPEAVQYLTYLNPMRYFLIVIRGVFLEGNDYSLLISQYWPMALIGMVSLALAGWLFRHRMY